ncbi:hypothetical protein HDR70_02255 [bacterium]|nr:hypothetical protein [bacterium]
MKKHLNKLFIIVMSILWTNTAIADLINSDYVDVGTISTSLVAFNKYDEEPEEPVKGRRIPSKRVSVRISQCNVAIVGVEEDEIISFEIQTPDEIPVLYTSSVCDFTNVIFSLTGEFEIRFQTLDALYIGYVQLE